MPQTIQQKTLQRTRRDAFAISHPGEVKIEVYLERIEKTCALLERMIPEIKEWSLSFSVTRE